MVSSKIIFSAYLLWFHNWCMSEWMTAIPYYPNARHAIAITSKNIQKLYKWL